MTRGRWLPGSELPDNEDPRYCHSPHGHSPHGVDRISWSEQHKLTLDR